MIRVGSFFFDLPPAAIAVEAATAIMCDMQNMPTREDASCEEDPEMNFTAFSTVGTAGTHFVTTSQQLPKLQQNVSNNGSLSQMVGMVSGVSMSDGVQYVRALDGGGALQGTPQIISVPIALPGSKPGDPQQTVQIQVLTPNLLQPQQPKYQMQIPGFQQAGTVLTVAYSPDNNENGIQLVQTNTADGQIQLVVPQEMQMVQPAQVQTAKQQPVEHQVIITQDQQIIINGSDIGKLNNNNISSGIASVVVKEECVEMDEDETSQDVDTTWDSNANQDLIKYLNTLPPQQTQALPVSLQQFLRLNPVDKKPVIQPETVVIQMDEMDDMKEAELGEDGSIRITKKKKKYKKKPPRPARPKPGQVIIATAEDGTPIYCCPECSMAYPEKEQLEMHLIVHKIERRYICGICGAGLKRKEHLERHKMGHNPERPYVCSVCNKGFKRREHLNLHTVIHSGVKTEMCTECGKGFYRKDHLRKHMRFHENKRARDEAAHEPHDAKPANIATMSTSTNPTTLLPEITIHVPTSANMQVPVQINIPQHVVTSLAQAQALTQANDTQSQLDALLAQHS